MIPSPSDGGGIGWGWINRFFPPPLSPLPPGEGRQIEEGKNLIHEKPEKAEFLTLGTWKQKSDSFKVC